MELKETLDSLGYSKGQDAFLPTHVAWVPCVSGHLDFALMRVGLEGAQDKKGERDEPNFSVNYVSDGARGGHQRNILLESWVDWRDSDEGDGKFRVVLAAKSNYSRDLDRRSLRGQVFIYPKSYEHGALAPKAEKLLSDIRGLHKNLLKTDDKLYDWSENQAELNKIFDNIKKTIDVSAPFGFPDDVDNDTPIQHQYVVDFWVSHNGITFMGLREKKHEKAFDVSDEVRYTVIRQAFYYIKYGLHTHKHHDFERDALTTVVPIHNSPLSDIWLQLVGQLKRELVRIKRAYSIAENSIRVDDVHSAEGILAYSRTLITQLKHRKFLANELASRELRSLDGVQESLNAHVNKAEREREKAEREEDITRNWNMFLIALFGALGVAGNNIFKAVSDEANLFSILMIVICFIGIIYAAIHMAISKIKKKQESFIYTENLIRENGFLNKRKVMIGIRAFATTLSIILMLMSLPDGWFFVLISYWQEHLKIPFQEWHIVQWLSLDTLPGN